MLSILGVAALACCISPAEPSADSLVSLLRHGGYIVMVRHTHTDRSVQEPMNYVSADRSTQRNLSDRGVADAKLIGNVMKRFALPFGEIVSSPMYRTVETAQMAFGKPDTTMLLREFMETPPQRALIVKAPAPHTNRVLVTHHFIIERYAPGIRPGDIDEGEAVVVRSEPDKSLTLIGRFKLADWRRLAGAKPTTSATLPPSAAPVAHGTNAAHTDAAAAHSPATRIAEAYMRAFNTGSADSMRVFLHATMVPDPHRDLAARVQTYTSTYAQHGPMTVLGFVSATQTESSFKVKTRVGEFTLTVKGDPANPARALSVMMMGMGGGH